MNSSNTLKIAVIPGDGIGNEVVPAAVDVLDKLAANHGIRFDWTWFDWSCEHYHSHGQMMPDDGLEQLSRHDAIFLGAVGYPGVPDHVSLWGLLIPIRREFQQYANVRPIKLLDGIESPLRNRTAKDIDFVVVRENNEGEYSEIGGRLNRGSEDELCVQESVFTRKGCDRIMHYAFDLARKESRGKVTSATKSNGIIHTMPYWDERFAAVSAAYPEIATDQYHIDILTANFVLHPDWFDVVVGSNLLGDCLLYTSPSPRDGATSRMPSSA